MEKQEYKKNCLWCGKEFSIFCFDKRRIRRAYCSADCQRQAEAKQKEEYLQRKRLESILLFKKEEPRKISNGDPYEWLKRVDARIRENGGHYYK